MDANTDTVDAYIAALPPARKDYMNKLRETVITNLPEGFEEVMAYGMIGYVVPHSIYPAGYRANPQQPLPFINIASQKNYIALYHMGLYGDAALLSWFSDAYARQCGHKLDMGKSCIRFKKPEKIPFDLIGELVSKVSVKAWIDQYETVAKKA